MNNSLDDFIGSEAFWTQVADFAERSHNQYGQGAVLLHEESTHQESSNRANVGVSYLPMTDPSPLWTDDTKKMASEVNTNNEFMVISIQQDGEALSMIMNKDGSSAE